VSQFMVGRTEEPTTIPINCLQQRVVLLFLKPMLHQH